MSKSSVPAQNIIDECRARGYLSKQFYAVFTKPAHGIEPIMENLGPHLEYQEKLERDGIMFAAGPNWTDEGSFWEGDGMIIYRANSLESAVEIASQDPMHISGARTFTVRPWFVNEGTMTIQLGFATGRFKLT